MKRHDYCPFAFATELERDNMMRRMAGKMSHMTGRWHFAKTYPAQDKTILDVELWSPWRWDKDVLADQEFRDIVAGIDHVGFVVAGHRWRRPHFAHPPEYQHAVKMKPGTIRGAFKRRTSQSADVEWIMPSLSPETADIFEDLGLTDYKLGMEYDRFLEAGQNPQGLNYALFKDFDQYALAKLRF